MTPTRTTGGYRHEAVLYAGVDDFVERTAPFVRDAANDGAAVLAAVVPDNLAALRRALPAGLDHVRLADMTELGRNPAHIIPLWRDFADSFSGSGRPLRGIGEPVWAGRNPHELEECERHEALLNLAFANEPDFVLLCPYDEMALSADALGVSCATHPTVRDRDGTASAGRLDFLAYNPFDGDLPPAPESRAQVALVDGSSMRLVRRAVADAAASAGLPAASADDFVAAAAEVAANTLLHGEGGLAQVWNTGTTAVCNVEGGGRLVDPLVGRVRPDVDSTSGRGLWLASQLCDLVQIRSSAARTVVRLHMGA